MRKVVELHDLDFTVRIEGQKLILEAPWALGTDPVLEQHPDGVFDHDLRYTVITYEAGYESNGPEIDALDVQKLFEQWSIEGSLETSISKRRTRLRADRDLSVSFVQPREEFLVDLLSNLDLLTVENENIYLKILNVFHTMYAEHTEKLRKTATALEVKLNFLPPVRVKKRK